jgi:hypothetical protein
MIASVEESIDDIAIVITIIITIIALSLAAVVAGGRLKDNKTLKRLEARTSF